MKITIGSWVSGNAVRHPDNVALIDAETGQSLTYRTLNERTDQLASSLSNAGVSQGDRVALVTLNSTDMLEVIIAVSKLGAVSVPINFRLTSREIRFILEDSGAVLCFASDVFIPTVAPAAEGLDIKQVVSVPSKMSQEPREASTYDEFLASGGDRVQSPPAEWNELAMLMYTSGTTGNPKGAMLTKGNLFANSIQSAERTLGVRMDDINLSVAPLFHIGALGIHTLPLLYWAGCTVIAEAFDPETWAAQVEKYRATKTFLVPTMWHTVVASGALDKHDMSSLNIGFSGGAPCPVALIEKLIEHDIPIIEGFGMTETSPVVSFNDAKTAITKAGTIGRPVMHVEMRVVDSSRNDVPVGEVGELALSGPSIISAYWNRPDTNATSFEDGWFFTGDMAKVDEDGYWYIVDRKKDMLITGGENVYPVEVEQMLYRHDAVAEVAVVGTADETWGEVVTAYIVLAGGHTPSDELTARIEEFSREHLASYKIPRRIRFVAELPKTATGKIRKTVLRSEGFA